MGEVLTHYEHFGSVGKNDFHQSNTSSRRAVCYMQTQINGVECLSVGTFRYSSGSYHLVWLNDLIQSITIPLFHI